MRRAHYGKFFLQERLTLGFMSNLNIIMEGASSFVFRPSNVALALDLIVKLSSFS